MDLKELQRNWHELGKTDPFWAVLTDPQKRGRRWDEHEFFKTGDKDVAGLMRYVDSLAIVPQRDRVLDFGCGVGRLTQSFCSYFRLCYGVDIAPSMIELANKYNRRGDRCRYYVNETNDLRIFENDYFDFVCSIITLQHMIPKHSLKYVKEFVRVLRPGGLVLFQVPSERKIVRRPERSEIYQPLSELAFKAQIAVPDQSIVADAGTQLEIRVRVRNISDITWPAVGDAENRFQVQLGNHWLDDGGRVVVYNDGRVGLPANLKPLEEVELTLPVVIPAEPGDYSLELDMVQESVAWFGDKGSSTTKVSVQAMSRHGDVSKPRATTIPGGQGGASAEKNFPTMEMHCVPRAKVLRAIAKGRGKILDVHEDHLLGEGWLSLRYIVTK